MGKYPQELLCGRMGRRLMCVHASGWAVGDRSGELDDAVDRYGKLDGWAGLGEVAGSRE